MSRIEPVAIDVEYDEFIDRIARSDDTRTITNSSTAHALSIVRAMFRYGEKDIRIFSGSLSPEVFDDEDLIRSAEKFVESGGQVQILLQATEQCGQISKMMDLMKRLAIKDEAPVTLKRVTQGHPFAKASAQFIVADGRAYRIETDIIKHKAVASFRDSERAPHLESIFDHAFLSKETSPVL